MEDSHYEESQGKCTKPLLCNYCINRRLADLRRKRDQEEREAKLKHEQQQLE